MIIILLLIVFTLLFLTIITLYANIIYIIQIYKSVFVSFNQENLLAGISSVVFLDAGLVTIFGITTFVYAKRSIFKKLCIHTIEKMSKSKFVILNNFAIYVGEKTIYPKVKKKKDEK